MKRKIILTMFVFGFALFFASAEDVFAQRKSVSGKEVTGTFRMNFGGEFKSSFNEIKVLALGNNRVKVEFILLYPSRYGKGKDDITANMGEAEGVAEINGDTAVYSSAEYGGCEIKIKFVKSGQIKVTQTENDLQGCGFGMNVTATGTYKKVSSSKPVFEVDDSSKAKNVKKSDLTGKYVHQGKQGETSYRFVLELKDKNIASYGSEYTGGTSENSGTWSFDEKKYLVTVKLGGGSVIVFRQAGENLEVVEKPDDTDPIYGKGTVFEKV